MPLRKQQRRFLNRVRRRVIAGHYLHVWRNGQELRRRILKRQRLLFPEMVAASVDVLRAPQLASYTQDWAPLSDRWVEEKGSEEFFIDTGQLARYLLRQHPRQLFGVPQVWIDLPSRSVRVTTRPPPKWLLEHPLVRTMYRVVPFPDLDLNEPAQAEIVLAQGHQKIYGQLVRWGRFMVTPYFKWWVQVHTRRIINEVLNDRYFG